jgi:hypothetical protein
MWSYWVVIFSFWVMNHWAELHILDDVTLRHNGFWTPNEGLEGLSPAWDVQDPCNRGGFYQSYNITKGKTTRSTLLLNNFPSYIIVDLVVFSPVLYDHLFKTSVNYFWQKVIYWMMKPKMNHEQIKMKIVIHLTLFLRVGWLNFSLLGGCLWIISHVFFSGGFRVIHHPADQNWQLTYGQFFHRPEEMGTTREVHHSPVTNWDDAKTMTHKSSYWLWLQ